MRPDVTSVERSLKIKMKSSQPGSRRRAIARWRSSSRDDWLNKTWSCWPTRSQQWRNHITRSTSQPHPSRWSDTCCASMRDVTKCVTNACRKWRVSGLVVRVRWVMRCETFSRCHSVSDVTDGTRWMSDKGSSICISLNFRNNLQM